MAQTYDPAQPSRADIDALNGPVVLDFGTNWCGHCQASLPVVAQAMAGPAGVRHIRVEDGSGRPLGRSFHVKLWPTLVFLRDGQEVERLVRPLAPALVSQALDRISGPAA